MNPSRQPELNSKYAWREVPRLGLPKRPAHERIADFLEIYGLYDEATAREQASRCIQCPNPGCITGCPLCNPIPQWMSLAAEGRFMEAAAYLSSVTNMADICARLCPRERMCEETCVLNGVSDPVAIGDIERFLMDYALAHGAADSSTPPACGQRVAVIGSGPGGLACADEMARRGYGVTIFESTDVPGGMLCGGLPSFRLEKSIVQRRIELLEKRGVVFRFGAALGTGMTLAKLRAEFNAVYLGFDSRQPRPLTIPGANLEGVFQGLNFVLQKNSALRLELPPLEMPGKRLVVIGGGDTAIDCLRTALRCGVNETTGVYRREAADMPCISHEYHNAVEEGAKFLFNAAPVEVLGNPAGAVRGLRLVKTEVGTIAPDGRRPFKSLPGTEFEIAADYVILALGYDPLPCPREGDFGELEINRWGGLMVDEGQATNIPGVYAGGDVVRGPCSALLSVRDARRAAASMHATLLKGRAVAPAVTAP